MPRRFLFSTLVGFCGGIILAEFWRPPFFWLGIVSTLSIFCCRWRRASMIMMVLFAITVGVFRFSVVTLPQPGSLYYRANQNISVRGQIIGLPNRDSQQAIILGGLSTGGQPVKGKVQMYLPLWPEYSPGQTLRTDCQVMALSYKKYPLPWSHGIQARCSSVTGVTAVTEKKTWRSILSQFFGLAIQKVASNFSQPQSSLLSGIIFGSQNGMPDSLRQQFQATGTTHIIALSGFNVTIIVSAMLQVLVRLIGRKSAWLPGLVAVVIFVIMTGASASVVRAAIMAVITQLGLFLGRPVAPKRLLSYAALLMLWVNPLIMAHDLGFQLSFLATVGLVFFSKPLAARMRFVPEFFGLKESLSTTLAAILLTEPLLLWHFGRLSLIAPLVNIIVLPLIPLIMGVGTLWLMAQLIHPILGSVVQPLTDVLLRVVLWLIASGANTTLALVHISGFVPGLIAAVFIFFVIQIRRTYVPETDPA